MTEETERTFPSNFNEKIVDFGYEIKLAVLKILFPDDLPDPTLNFKPFDYRVVFVLDGKGDHNRVRTILDEYNVQMDTMQVSAYELFWFTTMTDKKGSLHSILPIATLNLAQVLLEDIGNLEEKLHLVEENEEAAISLISYEDTKFISMVNDDGYDLTELKDIIIVMFDTLLCKKDEKGVCDETSFIQ